jgi:hypothetical protein
VSSYSSTTQQKYKAKKNCTPSALKIKEKMRLLLAKTGFVVKKGYTKTMRREYRMSNEPPIAASGLAYSFLSGDVHR